MTVPVSAGSSNPKCVHNGSTFMAIVCLMLIGPDGRPHNSPQSPQLTAIAPRFGPGPGARLNVRLDLVL